MIQRAWWCGTLLAVLVCTAPAVAQSAEVEQVLDRLEREGEKINDLEADLRHEVFDKLIEDKQVKTGWLKYRRGEPNAQFMIHFSRLDQGGVINENGEWYAFDGRWLTEAKAMTKQVVKREVVPEGERVDPFKLGEGPFPLPFGQKKAEMLEQFSITLAPPAPGDPKNADHLRCIPLPGSTFEEDYSQLDMFIDRTSNLPAKIVADQKREDKRVTVEFSNMKLNSGLPASALLFHAPASWPAPVIERLQPPPSP